MSQRTHLLQQTTYFWWRVRTSFLEHVLQSRIFGTRCGTSMLCSSVGVRATQSAFYTWDLHCLGESFPPSVAAAHQSSRHREACLTSVASFVFYFSAVPLPGELSRGLQLLVLRMAVRVPSSVAVKPGWPCLTPDFIFWSGCVLAQCVGR